MRRLIFALAVLLLPPTAAWGQSSGAVTPGNAGNRSDLAGCVYVASPGTASNNQQRAIQCDSSGNLKTTGTVSGDVTVSGSVTSTQGTSPWVVSGNVGLAPQTSGGLSTAAAISAASTNSTSVAAVPAQLYGVSLGSLSTTPAVLKLYNTSSAPNCTQGTPVRRYVIQGVGSSLGASVIDSIVNGIAFSVGIGYCLTAGVANTDGTAVGASAFTINIDYK